MVAEAAELLQLVEGEAVTEQEPAWGSAVHLAVHSIAGTSPCNSHSLHKLHMDLGLRRRADCSIAGTVRIEQRSQHSTALLELVTGLKDFLGEQRVLVLRNLHTDPVAGHDLHILHGRSSARRH